MAPKDWKAVYIFSLFLLTFLYSPGHREYHVQFFGSVAERAWIHEKRIVMYQGEHQFEELQAETLRKTTNLAEKHKVHPVTD